MEIKNTFNILASKPDLQTAVGVANNKNALDLNCMRIGIVQEFYEEDLTVSVQITNKREDRLNNNGTQQCRDFALVRAKVCYCNPFITCPINVGDECILLFNDREIESWFVTGEVNPIAYPRMHDLTDAVAIFGIRSLPQMIQLAKDCLNLMYIGSEKTNSIQIKETCIYTGGEQCIADGMHTVTNGSVITTKNGIITSII